MKNFKGKLRQSAFAVFLLIAVAFVATTLSKGYAYATDLPVVIENGGTLSSNETWTAGSVYWITGTVIVPDDVTLTIDAGAIVKVNGSTYGIQVDQGGVLNVDGTSASTVTFTSATDDTAGGDSNGDGSSTNASSQTYLAAVITNGGEESISYGVFRNGFISINYMTGMYAPCYGVTGSLGSLSVADSIFEETTVASSNCNDQITFERNSFNLPTNNLALDVYSTDLTGVILSGADKNTFTGSVAQRQVRVAGAVPTGKTWTASSASSGIINLLPITIDGTVNFGSGMSVIASADWGSSQVNGTLNIGAGSLVKVNGYAGSGDAFIVNDGGALNVTGTSMAPVVFTSLKDDSIDGDYGNDGSTSGVVADYGNAIQIKDGGTATIDHAEVRYGGHLLNQEGGELTVNNTELHDAYSGYDATGGKSDMEGMDIHDVEVGLNVGGDTEAVFRGTIDDASIMAIQACNWGYDCKVDAAYSSWGSDYGPFPPAGKLVCGSVTVSPWNTSTSTANNTLFSTRNCDNSPTPDQVLADEIADFQVRTAAMSLDCENLIHDACDAYSQAYACLTGAVNVAGSTSPFPLPDASTAGAVGTFGDDMLGLSSDFIGTLEDVSPGTFMLGLASGLASQLSVFSSLISAYHNCG
ncbi:MAG TPA: hypothetical protein VLF62_00010 [Candidatus Saccharimonadales bacterium]|nr:hypothetical protein [Candidatus Saccharimonadales bacterium]